MPLPLSPLRVFPPAPAPVPVSLAVALALAVLSSCAATPIAVRAPLASPTRVRTRAPYAPPPSRALEWIRTLASEAGPRLSGSPGDPLAVAWGVRVMRLAGLTNVHTESVRAPHWSRGAESGEIVTPVPHVLSLAALGGSVGTDAPVEAEVVEVQTLDAIGTLAPTSVRGHIVFVNHRMERARDGGGYGRGIGVRLRAAVVAARAGAIAVVIRSIGTDNARTPHTGMMLYADGVPRIPAAALSHPDADVLHDLVASGSAVRIRMSLGARLLPEVDTANVVGEVRGSERPDEVVLMGGHLDSWDLGMGAIDDGAGCAIVLEAARRLAERARPPRRTLRIVFFANEENGGAGARAYAQAHADELSRHIVALEADTGDGRVYGVRYSGAAESRPLFRRVLRALRPLHLVVDDDPAHGGADLGPLSPAHVPLIDLRQDMTTYFDYHHTANDTPAIVDAAALDQAVDAYARLAGALVDMDGDFGRAPPRPER